jgi:hypothetical protein
MKKIYVWATAALIFMAAPCAQAQTECSSAEDLALNAESPALPQLSYRWYKVNLAAGKIYAMEWTNNSNDGYFLVYTACGGNTVGSNGVCEITTAGTYYIQACSYVANDKF